MTDAGRRFSEEAMSAREQLFHELGSAFIQKQQLNAALASSFLEHLCLLDIDSEPTTARNTSIVCTIGPASRSVETLKEMIKAGMNIARLNFSHGSHEYHAASIRNIREAAASFSSTPLYQRIVAIALDTKGPEIRTGLVKGSESGEVELLKGSEVKVTTDRSLREECSEQLVWVDYGNLTRVVRVGGKIYIDDGLISLIITEIGEDFCLTEVENGGTLCSRKGVNLPEAALDLPAVSEQDVKDLLFGLDHGVDMVFASFIRKAEDVRAIRRVLGERGKQLKIISKIENHEGVRRFDEILPISDGVMVARGDLGIEIPAEKVFLAQKMIIGRCNHAGKPVICATQIAREAEAAVFHQQLFDELRRSMPLTRDPTEVTAVAAVEASFKSCSGAIIVLTNSGRTAQLVSKYRPRAPIIAVTRNQQVARQGHLYRGIFPVLYGEPVLEVWSEDVDQRVSFGMEIAKTREFVRVGDVVIVLTGWRSGAGATNIMRVMPVP
ncbi:pyruvate kinase PKM-like isoform X2 [Scyliorhinus torazame]|uniref:pyruvate kinase PKM-like isoform X2 n=1 Tax=Scyliorhinus torazame TaxID=75743 RepID=UPI003B59E0F1